MGCHSTICKQNRFGIIFLNFSYFYRQHNAAHSTSNHERNEQATLQWAKTSMHELRVEMRELGESVNNSALLRQLHVIRNEVSAREPMIP